MARTIRLMADTPDAMTTLRFATEQPPGSASTHNWPQIGTCGILHGGSLALPPRARRWRCSRIGRLAFCHVRMAALAAPSPSVHLRVDGAGFAECLRIDSAPRGGPDSSIKPFYEAGEPDGGTGGSLDRVYLGALRHAQGCRVRFRALSESTADGESVGCHRPGHGWAPKRLAEHCHAFSGNVRAMRPHADAGTGSCAVEHLLSRSLMNCRSRRPTGRPLALHRGRDALPGRRPGRPPVARRPTAGQFMLRACACARARGNR